jgi:hypothetical protein
VEFGPRSVDREIAVLARRQHGVIATRQLVELGLSQQAVSHRVAAGRLHRVHHGVYAVGHTVLAIRGHWMAAVLACGPDAALSHAAAAALWDIRRTERSSSTSPPGAPGASAPACASTARAGRPRPRSATASR